MLVFIDESGDAGFRLDKGSTPIFAAAMVIFRDRSEADRASAAIRQALVDLRMKPEFKFNRCSDKVRDGFFAAIGGFDFRVRALVVEKTVIDAPQELGGRDAFYRHFVRAMIRHERGALVDAKIVIDGSGDRSFQRDLKTAILTGAAPGAIRKVQLKDSARDPLLQLADMCVAPSRARTATVGRGVVAGGRCSPARSTTSGISGEKGASRLLSSPSTGRPPYGDFSVQRDDLTLRNVAGGAEKSMKRAIAHMSAAPFGPPGKRAAPS